MSTAGAIMSDVQWAPRTRVVARYASFESRIVAAILDVFVGLTIVALCLLAGSLVVLFASDFERIDPSDTALYTFWGMAGASLPAIFIYVFVGYTWKGQTLGAAVMQIMVLRSDGRRLGPLGATARIIGLLAYPLFLAIGGAVAYATGGRTVLAGAAIGIAVLLSIAGILWAAFDRRRRMLHDRLAGTIVVRLE